MCLNPRRIPNPYLGLAKVGLNFLHDCTAQYMEVPCGHCPQCVAMKQSYIVQRSQMEAVENDLFFCTLTYKTSMLRSIDCSTGYRFRYADIRDVQNMIKRLRKNDSFGLPFRFWGVTEYGGKKHRPHFHLIFSFPKIPGETRSALLAREKRYHDIVLGEWRRNVATCVDKYGRTVANTRSPKYEKLCDYVVTWRNGKCHRTFDFHWIDPTVTDSKGKIHDESDVAFYVTKYTLKANKYVDSLKSALRLNLDADEFTALWSLLRPKALVSKKWGNPDSPRVKTHIRESIERAKANSSPYPYFLNPNTGQTFPLAPFYKTKFLTMEDAFDFYYMSTDTDYGTSDAFRPSKEVDPIDRDQRYLKFNRLKFLVNERESNDPFESYDTREVYNQDSDYLFDDLADFMSLSDVLITCNSVDPPAEYQGEYYQEFDYSDF